MKFILASASPRRKELLERIVKDFKIIPSECEEKVDSSQPPNRIVENLALQKAEDVFLRNNRDVVIGSDTVVAINHRILGKPKDKQEAAEMLSLLSGCTHSVFTGVAVLTERQKQVFSVETKVQFKTLTQKEILNYINTKEPMDKAGAYGIQGYGSLFVKGIEGDYFNVMGLPVNALYEKLTEMDLI